MEEEKEDVIKEEVAPSQNKSKWPIIQIIFLILMLGCLIGLIVAIVTIYKYKDMIENPVGANLDNFGLKYCTCYDYENRIVPIHAVSYNGSLADLMPQPVYDFTKPQINFSSLEPTE